MGESAFGPDAQCAAPTRPTASALAAQLGLGQRGACGARRPSSASAGAARARGGSARRCAARRRRCSVSRRRLSTGARETAGTSAHRRGDGDGRRWARRQRAWRGGRLWSGRRGFGPRRSGRELSGRRRHARGGGRVVRRCRERRGESEAALSGVARLSAIFELKKLSRRKLAQKNSWGLRKILKTFMEVGN
jgi:hypothetical protein